MSARIAVRGQWIEVHAPYALKDSLRAAGGWWSPEAKAWMFEATPQNACSIKGIVARPETTPEFDRLLDGWQQCKAIGIFTLEQRYALDAPEIPGLTGSSWAHQRRAYADAMSRPATMLAMGMGAGKSRVAIGAVLNRDVKQVLILCPLSVVPVWPAEFVKHAGDQVTVVSVGDGSVVSKKLIAQRALDRIPSKVVIVINYDSARMEPFRSWSLSAGFDMAICDESHKIKAAGGVTSRYVAALGRQARYRLCLSGTPAAHSPLDLYGQYRFLDPGIYGTSKLRFDMRYAVKGGYQNHEIIGYQNVDEFNRKYHSIAFQVGREVLDLPEVTEVTRYCELGAEGRRVYHDLERRFYAEVAEGSLTIQNALTKALRLAQVTGGAMPLDNRTGVRSIDTSKRDLLREVLDEIGDEPVVVFCRFRHDLDQVLSVGGEEVRELTGRKNELAAWQAGDGRILAAQVQAGSLGVSMVRAAYVLWFSVGYSLGEYEQAKARVHRPGQDRPVTYVKLVARNTVDETIYKALDERRDVIEAVLARRV